MKKAKESYDLYKDSLLSDNSETVKNAATSLITDLLQEEIEISEQRRAKHSQAQIAIIRETNQKWNAIVSLFENEYGKSPIVRNGYRVYWLMKMPELIGKL